MEGFSESVKKAKLWWKWWDNVESSHGFKSTAHTQNSEVFLLRTSRNVNASVVATYKNPQIY